MTVALKDSMQNWQRMEDVDFWVQEAASLYATVPGASVEYVAAYLGRGKDMVKTAFSHPVVQAHIKSLEFQILKGQNQIAEDLTEIRSNSIDRIKELVPEASIKDTLAIAKFACEVHPDRKFVKLEKKQHDHQHTHRASNELLNTLKQRHLTATKPIQIEAQVTDYEPEQHDENYVPELVEA